MNGTTITYDEIGNPSSNGAYHQYTWQNGRQLAQIFDMSRVYTYTYTYNADGIRTSKTVNGVKHTYALNGSQIVSEEWKVGSTTHTLVYLYDESGLPIGLQYHTSSMANGVFNNYFFEKNMQGDITAIFKENGAKIGAYTYDSWGNVKTTVYSNATTLEKSIVQSYNPFRYRGYYYDTESGLYYLQSRYYNPEWGRFLNADGYINANGDIIGYNLYVYCSNNPVMYIDPTGYIAIIDDILIFTTITVVVVVALNLPKIYNTIMSVVYGILAIVDTVTEAFSKIISDSSNSDDLERPTDESGKIIVTPGDPPRESDGYRAPKHGPEKGKTKSGKREWKDKNGNIWVPVPTGTQSAHGGGHWDVTLPDESGYINVYPGGKTRAGRGKTPIFNK